MKSQTSLPQFIVGNPLYFTFAVPFLVDSLLTLLGQSSAYWHNHLAANEISPTYFVLSLGPIVYRIFAISWAIVLYIILKLAKEPWSLFLSMGFLVYHTQGSSAWIALELKRMNLLSFPSRGSLFVSWVVIAIYFVLVAICAGYSLRIYLRKRSQIGTLTNSIE